MMTKLKVALVSTYPPGQGTLNEYGYHLVRALREHPCISELTIIADRLPEGVRYELEPGEGCKVSIVEAWRFNGWLNPWKIIRSVRKARPDVVLFNIQFLSFGDGKVQAALGLLTPFFLRLCGYHSVLLLHNILEQVDLKHAGITQNRLLAAIYNFIGTMLSRFVLSADLVAVTISKYVRVLEGKYKAKNVALVPHGSFEIAPMPSLDLPPGPAKVMTFGKFGTYKKVEVMIEAVILFREKCNIPVEIVVAGTDSPNRKGYLEEVKQRYAQVPGITFTGYVPEEAVPALFAESAVVVFPYTSTTGSSGVLHQAGNYAKAVILPAIGDLGELIREEGYAGELFRPDDAESLSIALQRVLEDDGYRRSLSIKNYFAAVSLPMKEIVDWYYIHFLGVLKKLPG
ncbi:MAG: glycosyltransferase [Chitinophagaceae bacterium]|nr:glycosyltransferase [Chitinophagaceae bacterium]